MVRWSACTQSDQRTIVGIERPNARIKDTLTHSSENYCFWKMPPGEGLICIL